MGAGGLSHPSAVPPSPRSPGGVTLHIILMLHKSSWLVVTEASRSCHLCLARPQNGLSTLLSVPAVPEVTHNVGEIINIPNIHSSKGPHAAHAASTGSTGCRQFPALSPTCPLVLHDWVCLSFHHCDIRTDTGPGLDQCQCSDSHNPSSTPISSSPEKNIHHLFRIPMTTDHGLRWQLTA
ncbi:unnamed protein product [Pleuronectes platessa]|uniref:Uncharacterized protein n=1 Tax=Pleuronectes platessa TaxID=8262 RepID=A0A9N7YA20_PLEPL|nr:unnamed protein product [Pleuronectes platessa]